MNAYIYKCNSPVLGTIVTLAPIYANSLEEAQKQLPIEHAWCGATINNTTSIRCVGIEEPLMFDVLLPNY